MQIRFAQTRPSNDDALVLFARGSQRPSFDGLGPVGGALDRQRFEGDAGSAAEAFGPTGQRIVVVGLGGKPDAASAEQAGGAAVSRLLRSGERSAIFDMTGAGLDADTAGRLLLAAALRSWSYDQYRTKLKDKQKVSLDAVTVVGADAAVERLWSERFAALVDGVALTRELVTEPPNIIYPESFAERVKASVEGSGLNVRILGRDEMAKGILNRPPEITRFGS